MVTPAASAASSEPCMRIGRRRREWPAALVRSRISSRPGMCRYRAHHGHAQQGQAMGVTVIIEDGYWDEAGARICQHVAHG